MKVPKRQLFGAESGKSSIGKELTRFDKHRLGYFIFQLNDRRGNCKYDTVEQQ